MVIDLVDLKLIGKFHSSFELEQTFSLRLINHTLCFTCQERNLVPLAGKWTWASCLECFVIAVNSDLAVVIQKMWVPSQVPISEDMAVYPLPPLWMKATLYAQSYTAKCTYNAQTTFWISANKLPLISYCYLNTDVSSNFTACLSEKIVLFY